MSLVARLLVLEACRPTRPAGADSAAWLRTLTDAELDDVEALSQAAAAYPTPDAANAALPQWTAWQARYARWCQGGGGDS